MTVVLEVFLNQPELGTGVPFREQQILLEALVGTLGKNWDRQQIQSYATDNSWDSRVNVLRSEFNSLVNP